MTKREFDKANKIEDRSQLMSASQYRRDLGHVPAWIVDRLAARKPGTIKRTADIRAGRYVP
jgi:hypothetical protein